MFTALLASALLSHNIVSSDPANFVEQPSVLDRSGWPSQPAPSGPPCQEPPSGSSKEVHDCFDAACDTFTEAWNGCSDAECRTAALAQYLIDINVCVPTQQQPWATIWYFNGTYGVAFEPSAVPEGVVRFDY